MMADVNEENIGIRTFQLRKEKAVQRAVEKVRHNLKAEWRGLETREIDVFSWVLGETWATMGFYDWDKIRFSFIGLDNLKDIVSLGQQVLDNKKLGVKAFKEIHTILANLSSD